MNRRNFIQAAGALSGVPALEAAAAARKQLKITGMETELLRFQPGRIFYDAIHRFGDTGGGACCAC